MKTRDVNFEVLSTSIVVFKNDDIFGPLMLRRPIPIAPSVCYVVNCGQTKQDMPFNVYRSQVTE